MTVFSVPDPLASRPSAGEAGDRYVPSSRQATPNGGTSGAEDTTRAAGYVADLASLSAKSPGPAIPKDLALFVHPGKVPPPPPPRPPSAQAPASPSSTVRREPREPALDEAALARMQGESPAPVE